MKRGVEGAGKAGGWGLLFLLKQRLQFLPMGQAPAQQKHHPALALLSRSLVPPQTPPTARLGTSSFIHLPRLFLLVMKSGLYTVQRLSSFTADRKPLPRA